MTGVKAVATAVLVEQGTTSEWSLCSLLSRLQPFVCVRRLRAPLDVSAFTRAYARPTPVHQKKRDAAANLMQAACGLPTERESSHSAHADVLFPRFAM